MKTSPSKSAMDYEREAVPVTDATIVGSSTSIVRSALPVIFTLYLIFGLLHVFSTPIGGSGYQDAPDEAAHVNYIRTLVHGQLPSQSKPHGSLKFAPGEPDYEWHQPPLYYLVASVPFKIFGVFGARIFSLLLGSMSLWFTFLAVRLIFKTEELTALLAVGLSALIPAHVAILSAVNNDCLLEASFSAAVFFMLQICSGRLDLQTAVLLGLACGIGLMTKSTALLLVPVFVITLLYILITNRDKVKTKNLIRNGGVTVVVSVVNSAWWFIRNSSLYGQILPLNAFKRSFESTALATDVISGKLGIHVDGVVGYWQLLLQWCFQSFWAVYGTARSAVVGVQMWLPDQAYQICLAISILSAIGLAKLLIGRRRSLDVAQWRALMLLVLLILAVFAAYLLFAATYFQAQGRYLYPAMSAICILLAAGWLELFPNRYKRAGTIGLLSLMVLISMIFCIQTTNRSATIPPVALIGVYTDHNQRS